MIFKPLMTGAAAGFALGFALVPTSASAAIVGPSAYLCFDSSSTSGCGTADSPFKNKTYSYFHLETFEDGLLNTPGVTGSGASVFGPSPIADSVDADSGPVDGSGTSGRSFFGFTPVQLFFDATTLGSLPTDVGIVVTDGNNITVEFFDAGNNLLGSGLFVGDGAITGETAEDRFIGWSGTIGVARIRFASQGSGIEVDHLQYGLFRPSNPNPNPGVIPEPATWAMMIMGFGLVGGMMRRRGVATVSA
jgi:hypothetical protein